MRRQRIKIRLDDVIDIALHPSGGKVEEGDRDLRSVAQLASGRTSWLAAVTRSRHSVLEATLGRYGRVFDQELYWKFRLQAVVSGTSAGSNVSC
jgi:hypothetical protein